MGMIKSIGGFANGWAKFIVTLGAVGWFGAYALDELRQPRPSQKADPKSSVAHFDEGIAFTSTDKSLIAKKSSPVTTKAAPAASATNTKEAESKSVLMSLSSEVWQSVSPLMGYKTTQFTLAALGGAILGLVCRPPLTRLGQHRRLAAAKKRQTLFEEDRRLLAARGAVTNVAPGQTEYVSRPILPMPTSDSELVLPAARA